MSILLSIVAQTETPEKVKCFIIKQSTVGPLYKSDNELVVEIT